VRLDTDDPVPLPDQLKTTVAEIVRRTQGDAHVPS
jgi:hypothetical protein